MLALLLVSVAYVICTLLNFALTPISSMDDRDENIQRREGSLRYRIFPLLRYFLPCELDARKRRKQDEGRAPWKVTVLSCLAILPVSGF